MFRNPAVAAKQIFESMSDIQKDLSTLRRLYESGDYERASALAAQIEDLHPNESTAFQIRGFIFQTQGLFDKAAASFDRAIELRPDDPDNLLPTAFTQLQLGNWKRVIVDCTAGLNSGSKYHTETLLLFRAEALISLGRKAQAKADLLRVKSERNV